MDVTQRNEKCSDFFRECQGILDRKGLDYNGSDDGFHAIMECAREADIPPMKVFYTLMSKHFHSIGKYVRTKTLASEPIKGRLHDLSNFCALLAVYIDSLENSKEDPVLSVNLPSPLPNPEPLPLSESESVLPSNPEDIIGRRISFKDPSCDTSGIIYEGEAVYVLDQKDAFRAREATTGKIHCILSSWITRVWDWSSSEVNTEDAKIEEGVRVRFRVRLFLDHDFISPDAMPEYGYIIRRSHGNTGYLIRARGKQKFILVADGDYHIDEVASNA